MLNPLYSWVIYNKFRQNNYVLVKFRKTEFLKMQCFCLFYNDIYLAFNRINNRNWRAQ